MNWGTEKKIIYIGVISLIFLISISIFVYFKYFNKAQSCFDNKLNQDESGIDCGGVCALLCKDESRTPILSFERMYKISAGAYTAIALLENPNQGVFTRKMNYVFKIYDKENILLFEIPGTTFVPPGRLFPIFEHSILTGNREAVKETFEITDINIPWEKGVFNEPDVRVSNVINRVVDTRSRIEADIENKEVYPVRNLQVVVVVYDTDGNASEASATVLDYISPNESKHVSFTWNTKFLFEPSKIDIIPRPVPRDWQ